MISIMSKNVIALRNDTRINQEPWNRLQEWLTGVNPMASEQKHHDSGKPREVFPSPQAGPDSIKKEEGERGADDGVTSGYQIDVALYGGRADDGTGPGGSGMGVNHEQTYTTHDTQERNFDSEFDTSSKLNLINQDSSKRDSNPFPMNLRNQEANRNLSRIQQRPIRRNRAAQTWQRTFKV